MVDIGLNIDKFVLISEIFLRYPAAQSILEYIKLRSSQAMYNQKLSYTQYSLLTHELTKDANKQLLADNKDVLLDLPMTDWLLEIQKL
jgi:hypothetical protein